MQSTSGVWTAEQFQTMQNMTLEAFTQAIERNWAEHFGCPPGMVHQAGTTLLPEEQFSGSRVIALWYIGKHTFVQLDPSYKPGLDLVVNGLYPRVSLCAADLQQAWGEDAIESQYAHLAYYLYPPDLPAYLPPAPFVLRQLSPADSDHMRALHEANTPEDVEEGFVEVSHEIAFGCFSDDLLVAAASGYERTGFMDIGVLTHPAYRQKGLGKAVVGAVCKWSIQRDMIPQYRCNQQNYASAGVAERLHFRLYYKSEDVWMSQASLEQLDH